jgi:hypothetical protein
MRNYKNYFRDLSNELLKEELTVIVKRTGSPESDPPLFSSEKIPESVEDDLLWVLDRYKRSKFEKAPFKVKDKKGREVFAKAEDGKKKLLKLTPEASQEFSKVAAELQNYSGGTLDIERLQQVIDPWGQSGFDALLRILTVTRRLNRNKSEGDYFSFPFFKYENNVTLDGTVPLPSTNDGVPVELEKFLLSVRPGDKGTGELLFSLLVGGLVDQNVVADILVGTEFWEMKDMTYGEIRLGDASSNEFKNAFPAAWDEIIDLGESGEPVLLDSSQFLSQNLRTIAAYEKFRNSGSSGVPDFLKDTVVEKLDGVLHDSMKHSDSATKVTGVVGYVGGTDGFKMFPVESFTLSRIVSPFRVMARLK